MGTAALERARSTAPQLAPDEAAIVWLGGWWWWWWFSSARACVWTERYRELHLATWGWHRINVSANRPELVFGFLRPGFPSGRACQVSAELRPGELLAIGRRSPRSAVMFRCEAALGDWMQVDAGARLPRWGRIRASSEVGG